MHKCFIHTIILLIACFAVSCKTVKYSFTGVTIPPEIESVSIQYIQNQAPIVQPSLSQTFTEALKDKFISQTRLAVVNTGGDLDFNGNITNYSTKPVGIQGNETAALTRLTITVKIAFTNSKYEEFDFDTSFSAYSDFDSTKSLDEVEEDLMTEIVDQLVEDIFNKALVNW